MFHITLIPQRRDETLTLGRSGDILTIDDTPYDFGPLPEGATLPAAAVGCPWLASDVTRTGGTIHLTLILPHGPIPFPPPPEALAVTHPAPIIVSTDGPVTLPDYTPAEEFPE